MDVLIALEYQHIWQEGWISQEALVALTLGRRPVERPGQTGVAAAGMATGVAGESHILT